MAIVRWEPFRDLLTLQERMNRMFDELVPRPRHDEDWALGGSWAPAVDIYEQDGNIVLKAELPGVDPKDVDVRVENNVLTLRGERKFDNEVKRDNYHRVERVLRHLQPVVHPAERRRHRARSRPSTRTACCSVALPKREEAKPQQIQINVGK